MGNIDECISYFADSVAFATDGFDARIPKESLKAMFKGYREGLASLTIKMEDWEAVVSKDKKDEWVGLWYKEIWTDKAGKTDSVFVMDDIKIVGGKIAVFDEKRRTYPKK